MRRVAVIGGGPAGARVALRLAAEGLAVHLFEPRSDHEKACGGGIPARGLEAYPFLRDPRLPVRHVDSILLISPAGREAVVPLREPIGMFRRADLHRVMIDQAVAAGAALLRERVTRFARDADGWRLTTDRAGSPPTHGPFDLLVAADGAGGFARRRLAGDIPAAGLTQAVGYYLPGVTATRATLRFYAGLRGYLWDFPRVDHASIGICAPLGTRPAANLLNQVEEFIAGRYGAQALARAERYGALIPGAPDRPEPARLAGPGWAVAGDCARAVDPLTREGIYFALVSADLLADAYLGDRLEDYPARFEAALGDEFAWAARHQESFFDARFVERLVRLARRSPRIGVILSEVISGRQPYRSLRRRLIVNAPRVAWQALFGGRGATPLSAAHDS
ncbi:MAG TPA: NAD(P)/FAD-dependent oxidoreductase [Candidatus Polarisedimenticolia bacterium]|nr:NAD(P)/FAD-dependent oxidoreductase [Candidatus Polarisedimenticolia bacterium]